MKKQNIDVCHSACQWINKYLMKIFCLFNAELNDFQRKPALLEAGFLFAQTNVDIMILKVKKGIWIKMKTVKKNFTCTIVI